MRTLLFVVLLTVWKCFPLLTSADHQAFALDAAPAEQAGETVDDELLRQLNDALEDDLLEGDLLDGLGESADDESGLLDSLDEELLEGLDDGEDIGAQQEDPLRNVGRRMRTVEEQIAARRSGDATQRIQRQIVDQLNDLIKQVRKQCQSGQSGQTASSSKQTSQRQQVRQPGSPKSGTSQAVSNTAAADSTDRLDSTAAAAAETNRLKEMLKNVWGHLPEKLREQMLQNPTESFLPKYSLQIEEYYKRLADLESDNR